MATTAIVHANADGIITSWNEGAEALLGYPERDAVGTSLDLLVPQPYREAHWKGFRAAVERGTSTHTDPFVLPILCGDGQQRPFAGRLFFVTDAYDRAIGAMAVFVMEDASAGTKDLYRM